MANQANATRMTQMALMHGLAEQTAEFTRAGRVVTGPGGGFAVSGRAVGGLAATLAKTTSSLSATDIANFEAQVTTAHKVIKHTVNNKLLTTDMGYEDIGGELANKIMVSMDKDFFDFCEGLFSASHPRAGAGVFEVGAGKSYLDTGLAFLQTEGGAGTQDNLITTAFSENALDAALQLLWKYKDDRGVPLHLGLRGGVTLVVGPKNRKAAHEIVNSNLSGADMAVNTTKALISDIVCWNLTTDEDDWWIVDMNNAPIGTYIAAAPSVTVSPSADRLFTHFVAEYESVPFKLPYEYGIIGSNVA